MFAVVTSLLFGLAASMALAVVGSSLRSGFALGLALLRASGCSPVPTPISSRVAARPFGSTGFPRERDRSTALPAQRRRVAA